MVIISEIDDDQDLSDATSFANQESISHGLSGVKCDIRICADSVDDASLDGDEKDASPDGVNNPNDVIDEADVIDPDWFEDDLQFEPSAPKRYPAGDAENMNSDAGPVMVDDASAVPNMIENFDSTSLVKFVGLQHDGLDRRGVKSVRDRLIFASPRQTGSSSSLCQRRAGMYMITFDLIGHLKSLY